MAVKSYILLGNLPIGKNEFHSPDGCEYVINVRVKYERGIVSLQFIEQNEPDIFSVEKATLSPEIELDLSSLIRLKIFLKNGRVSTEFGKEQYLKVFSTKLSSSKAVTRGAYISIIGGTEGNYGTQIKIIIDNKSQKTFIMPMDLQFEFFKELINESIDMLKQSYIQYDVAKVMKPVSNSSFGTVQAPIGRAVDTKIVPNAPSIATGATVLKSAAFKSVPSIQPNNGTITLPEHVTKQVIPQAPDFNVGISDTSELNVQYI